VKKTGQQPLDEPVATAHAEKILEQFQILKQNLEKAQLANTKFYNRQQKPIEFAVGDQIWLHTTSIRTYHPSQKLSQKKIGPYTVTKIINRNVYELNLPANIQVWPVFNVNQLELYIFPLSEQLLPMLPNPKILDNELEWEVGAIVDVKQQNDEYFYKVH